MRAMQHAPDLFSHGKFWAARFGPAPFLPMSRAEMDALGWDSCDIILVAGDAYVDHPSFGMAIVGRLLEAQGFRVGIIAQPDWNSTADFKRLGAPNLFFGITAGNMDSMVNRYTADRRIRSDDAYTPGGVAGKRPDRAVIVYAQRVREAFKDVPIVIGGIEASLRRIAHFDYWSEKVRRSILLDARADLLVYGNAERAIVEIAHRLAKREPIASITDVRGTAFVRKAVARRLDRDRFDLDRRAGPACAAGRSVCSGARATRPSPTGAPAPVQVVRLRAAGPERDARQERHPHALLRDRARRSDPVCACLAHPACRIESGQCARSCAATRRRRCVAQPAAHPAYH